jgi:dipeptidyl aminopeptidase/acylaminoacyl peptidase
MMTSLIPRKLIFGNPDKAFVQISPDGARIGYLAPVDGVLNVWVGPADDPASAKPVTNDTKRGIRFFKWAYTSAHILYIQDIGGDENWRIYSVNLNSGNILDLTPFEGVQAQIQQVSHKFPDEILVGLNDRIPQLHDVYRININTGERSLMLENERFVAFVMDDELQVRLAIQSTPSGGGNIFKRADKWELFQEIPQADMLTSEPVGFDKSGKTLYMTDSRNRNTAALVAIDLETGAQTVIAENDEADVSDTLIHPTEKTIQAVAFTVERKEWQVFDSAIGEDLAYLKTIARGDVEILSRTLDDQHWIVVYSQDNGPVRFYHYDRKQRQARFLFTNRKALEELHLAQMHPITIPARDGLKLVSYFTLPVDSDSNSDARPDQPLPMVLFVHGGPWGRDNWGYHPVHQWLANRGYAVMSVNFRGSTGLGKDFTNAGDMEWGAKMHDDLIDAVDWAVREGIADPNRVAIMGGSYGGYATLAGVTFTPDKFACGVSIVGPSNLVTLLETIPPYWQPQIELFTTRVGDHRNEEGREFLKERSPLTYVDRIKRPLLIGQGANDPRVKQSESDQIVQAMQAKNIPVTYVLYPDEGHGFARPENNLSFFAVTEAFLARVLEERYEPIGSDFQGSSISVPTGANEIPELSEALAVANT